MSWSICVAIEFSRLYQAAWTMAFKTTLPGRLAQLNVRQQEQWQEHQAIERGKPVRAITGSLT